MRNSTKQLFTSILILAMLVLFNLTRYTELPKYKILKVANSDEFYIDFNNNNKIDNNELVKLYDVNIFHDTQDYTTIYQTKITGLSLGETLAIGILAKEFSQKHFANKKVGVELFDIAATKNKPFSKAKLYLDNKDIATILLNEGLGTNGKKESLYKKEMNFVKLKEHKNNIYKEKILILNTKTNTLHKINCPYIKNIKQAKAIRVADIPQNTKPCPYCLLHNSDNLYEKSINSFSLKNFDFTSGSLNFYFTDFNKRQKPDNNCLTPGCQVLLNQINAAKNSIDFAIYGISNQPKIINALIQAQNRGVKIRWVTDANTKGENIYEDVAKVQKLLPNYKTDNHIIPGETTKNSKYTNSIMHNKFFIFDKKAIWLGSANISQTDLADFNANIIVFSSSKILADIYLKEFEQMYNEKFHYIKQKITNKENIKIDPINTVSVYFSPKDDIINTQIIPLINNAKKYIYISSFIITNHDVKSALIKAKQRNVEIKIIIDATSAKGKYTIHNDLRQNNITVKVENKAGKMHTKSIVVDDKIAILGSMNLTQSGTSKNDENIIVLTNKQIVQTFRKHFLYLWNSIPEKWLNKNPSAESPDSPGSCLDGIDNDFDGYIDKEDPGCKFIKI